MLPVYRAVAESVGRSIGMPVQVRGEESYEPYRAADPDVSFICSLAYVALEEEGRVPAVPVAAPVVEGPRYGGRPIYFSDVVVRSEDAAASFADLRGRSWAFNEPWSQSGYGVTRYRLLEMGETPGFFGAVVRAGSHERALEMVLDGEVDATAIDSHLLGVLLRDDPLLAGSLRVIGELGPSTIQPVMVASRHGEPLRRAISDALLAVHEDPRCLPALRDGMIERFVAAGPADYDDVRRMAAAVARAGVSGFA
jgi:phosphonate transport system substrate-binding protein